MSDMGKESRAPVLDACLHSMGGEAGRAYGIAVKRSSLDGFRILQSPGLWGWDPSDNSYWQNGFLPDSSQCLLEAITDVIAGAHDFVDLSALEPLPSGRFLESILRGLEILDREKKAVSVRILFGAYPFSPETNETMDAFLRLVTEGRPEGSRLKIHACRMESRMAGLGSSWVHAKIVAADGQEVIVGGHNLWSEDYFGFAPVHDLSAGFSGPAAGEAHRYLNRLWSRVSQVRKMPPDGFLVHDRAWPDVSANIPMWSGGVIAEGGHPALSLARFGSGILEDEHVAAVAGTAPVAAFAGARSSIFLSQNDFAFHFEGRSYWPEETMKAMVSVLTDPGRAVDIRMVLSEPGSFAGCGGPYSFGETLEGVRRAFQDMIGSRTVTGSFHLAPIRFSSSGAVWEHNLKRLKIANHAKLWMVDERAFYIGSDNIYPHNLQEFGYLVESPPLARQVLSAYWEPLWKYSSPFAIRIA